MKKILIACIVAGAFIACNNGGDAAVENKVDSVQDKIDSSTDAKIDSLKDSANRVKEKVEATYEKTDSANKAISGTAAPQSGADSSKKQ